MSMTLPPGASEPHPVDQLVDNYFHAVEHGMLKVFAKMGISTLASYKVGRCRLTLRLSLG
jgi:glutamate synthase domain-containing protein 2